MNFEPYGVATFCDDIRHESNGKITLVGCYAGELIFGAKAPGMLPTFGAVINLRMPLEISPSKVVLRVVKTDGGEETTILEMNMEDFSKTVENMELPSGFSEDDRLIAIMVPCHWTMLKFSGPGAIKARAYIDDGPEMKLGALAVRFAEGSEQTPAVQR